MTDDRDRVDSDGCAGRSLRVAHVVQPTSGGVPRVVVDLASEGRRLGHDVVVLCPGDGSLGPQVREAGIEWRPLEMTRRPSFVDLRAIAALRTELAEFDIVHLHSSKAAAVGRVARLLGRTRRPRIIVVPHAWSWFVGGRLRWVYRWFERASRRLADVFVAVSAGESDAGRAVLGDLVPIRVIDNGVDTDRFRPAPAGMRTSSTILVLVGRLCEQKGQDRALRALALLPASFELVLVGDGPERGQLVELARELGVASRVVFAGSTAPLPHLQRADVVLVPSRWEGLSLSMLEAMACGNAIIATAVSGSEALDGGAGVLLPVDAEPDALAAAVVDLMSDRTRRVAIASAARRRAVERFGLRRMLDDYAALWDELIRGPDTPVS